MNKLGSILERTRTFFGEVKAELKKCAWPTRSELVDSTMVVVVSLVILGVYVGTSDFVVINLLKVLIR
jgi:preprotein translocase subunit SecE